MNFLRRLADLRAANTTATKATEALIEQADKDHQVALQMRDRVGKQAGKLQAADRANHYSESLTQSFRGRTA
jgi:hypothetical protein